MPIPGGTTARCRARTGARGLVLAGVLAAALLGGAPSGPAYAGSAPSGGFPPDSSTSVAPVVVPTTGSATLGATGAAPLRRPGGFGGATTGGSGGLVVHVTSGADSVVDPAPGTLRWALEQPGPRWIVFDRDLTITFTAGLRVPSDTTIDGRGHDVVLTGHGLPGLQLYDVRNVILENLVLRDFGDVARTEDNDPDDAVDVQRAQDVWIDHCTMSHVGDKLISTEGAVVGLTVSWNHFYDQEQTVQVGAMATAVGDARTTVTMDHNWFDHVGYRLPLVMYAKAHVYDNVMDHWSVSAVRSERTAQVYLERNLFLLGTQRRATTTTPAQVCNDKRTLCDDRDGYLADVANTYVGRARVAADSSAHVFDPRRAYDYTATPAVTGLATVLLQRAGARSAPVLAPLRVRLTGSGSGGSDGGPTDLLDVRTGTAGSARALVDVRTLVRGTWRTIRTTRLSSSGSALVVVRDAAPRRWNSYAVFVHRSRETRSAWSAPLTLR